MKQHGTYQQHARTHCQQKIRDMHAFTPLHMGRNRYAHSKHVKQQSTLPAAQTACQLLYARWPCLFASQQYIRLAVEQLGMPCSHVGYDCHWNKARRSMLTPTDAQHLIVFKSCTTQHSRHKTSSTTHTDRVDLFARSLASYPHELYAVIFCKAGTREAPSAFRA
jgi:hypothetical protein